MLTRAAGACSPRIRGDIAPASLKLCISPLEMSEQVGIRGDIAPASLKHRLDDVGILPERRIRGDIAPASLKPGPLPPEDRSAPGHPGRYRPGLIEADLPARTPSRQLRRIRGDIAPASLKLAGAAFRPVGRGASGAISPRPH